MTPTLLICDGFDDRFDMDNDETYGNINDGWGLYTYIWDGTYDTDDMEGISNEIAPYGGNCQSCAPNTNFGYTNFTIKQDLPTPQNHIMFGRANLCNQVGAEVIGYVWSEGAQTDIPVCTISETAAGQIEVYIYIGPGSYGIYRSDQCNLATSWGWKYMVAKMGIGNGAGSNYVKVWIDGEQVLNLTGLTIAGGTSPITVVGLPSADVAQDNIFCYYDSSEITEIAEPRMFALMPNGAGSNDDFTPNGAANNYECVSEVSQDFDVTYNSGSGSGSRDDFAMADLSSLTSSSGTVKALVLRIFCSADNSETLRPYVDIGGTRYYGSNFSPPAGRYLYAQHIWETNPSTSSPWTVTEIDGVKAGYEIL